MRSTTKSLTYKQVLRRLRDTPEKILSKGLNRTQQAKIREALNLLDGHESKNLGQEARRSYGEFLAVVKSKCNLEMALLFVVGIGKWKISTLKAKVREKLLRKVREKLGNLNLTGLSQYAYEKTVSTTQAGEVVFQALEDLFFSDMEWLGDLSLETLDSLSVGTRQHWLESCGFLPTILPAEDCWRCTSPTHEALVVATCKLNGPKARLNKIKTSPVPPYMAYEGGILIDDPNAPARVLAQLQEPNRRSPIALIDANLELEDHQMRIDPPMFRPSPKFETEVDIETTRNLKYIVTPDGCFTDLHIDYGVQALVSPLGKSDKIWILFPPTERNLRRFLRLPDGHNVILKTLAPDLEAGIVLRTTSKEALVNPAGVLHAVFTVKGGYMVGVDFLVWQNVLVYTRLLKTGAYRVFDRKGEVEAIFSDMCNMMVHAISRHARISEALDCMLAVLAELNSGKLPMEPSRAREKLSKLGERLTAVVTANFHRVQDSLYCPCGLPLTERHALAHIGDLRFGSC